MGMLIEVKNFLKSINDSILKFEKSNDDYYSIDRHIYEIDEVDIKELSVPIGMECLIEIVSLIALYSGPIYFSVPYLIIDDEWVLKMPNSPPPHIYLWLLRSKEISHYDHFSDSVAASEDEIKKFGLIEKEKWVIHRIDSNEFHEHGCWLVKKKY